MLMSYKPQHQIKVRMNTCAMNSTRQLFNFMCGHNVAYSILHKFETRFVHYSRYKAMLKLVSKELPSVS